jgi:hypothetical protein
LKSPKRPFNLKKVLIVASFFWAAVILADYATVAFWGPQIWAYAATFFGTDIKTTFVTLLFVEGAFVFTIGAIWAAGAMETTFEGDNLATNPYYQKEQWKQRREQTEGQNIAGKLLMLAGGPLLIASIILLFV